MARFLKLQTINLIIFNFKVDTKSGESKSNPTGEVATPSSGEPAAAHEAPTKSSDTQPLASISNQKSFSLRMRKFNRDEEGNKSFGSLTAHRKKFEKLNSRSGVDILDAYKARYAKKLLSNSGAEFNEHKENMLVQEKEKVVVARKMLQRNQGIDLTGEETPKRDSIVMSDDEIVVAAAESVAELAPDGVETVEISVDDKQVLINPEETKDRIANLEMNMKIMKKKKIVFV